MSPEVVPFLIFFGTGIVLGRIAAIVRRSYRVQLGRPGGPARYVAFLEAWFASLANEEPPGPR